MDAFIMGLLEGPRYYATHLIMKLYFFLELNLSLPKYYADCYRII